MNTLSYRIPFAASALLITVTAAGAFTDADAELKEAAATRLDRVVVTAKAKPPARAAWVPTSAKRLDGFKPVLPPERAMGLAMAEAHAQSRAQSQARTQTLARAEVPATAVAKR